MNINLILQTDLKWQNHSTNERYFFTYIDDEIVLLRLNNFPEEQLFTIIYGLEILDLDDAPESWEIPYE